jgi:hypothetical protein
MFFFASKENGINSETLQKGPWRKQKISTALLHVDSAGDTRELSVARRRRCFSHLGSKAVPRQTGSRRAPVAKDQHQRSPSSSLRIAPSSCARSSAAGAAVHGHQLGEVAHRTSAEARGRQRRQIHDGAPRNAAAGGENHHLQTPTAAPPPPKRRQPGS